MSEILMYDVSLIRNKIPDDFQRSLRTHARIATAFHRSIGSRTNALVCIFLHGYNRALYLCYCVLTSYMMCFSIQTELRHTFS